MIKKTITYTDYDDNTRTEDFYFNLSRAEVVEMAASDGGDLGTILKNIAETRDITGIIKYMKTIIEKSYGVKSLDGKRFNKSEEITNAFLQSEAYSELYMGFLANPNEFVDFVNGILPKDLNKTVDQIKI